MRNSGRRSGGQYGRRRDEEYARDEEPTQAVREQDADSLIADMAKGFVEAQAKIAGAPSGGPNQEMLAMLEKISRQLAELQNAPAGGQQSQERSQGDRQSQASTEQGKSGGQQEELSAIFSRLLAENKATGSSQQQVGGSQQQVGSSQQQGGGPQQQSGSQKSAGQSGAGQGGGQDASSRQQQNGGAQTVTARTAAQALAQAQYELANELEASLTKLKQVISESEKLADRISNLLGQENSSRQT